MAKTTKPPNPAATPPRHVLPPLFDDIDLVDRIFEMVAEMLSKRSASIPPQELEELKQDTREYFAGQQCYIPKRSRTARQQRVRDVLSMFNGRNATEVARRCQTSRAEVYRIVKQGRDD